MLKDEFPTDEGDYPVDYIKDPDAPKALFHIHVDAKDALPDDVMRELEMIGFIRDDFLQSGKGEPTHHMTVKPANNEEFKSIFLEADKILLEANRVSDRPIAVYTEGEFIPLDSELAAKPEFNQEFFDFICPLKANYIGEDFNSFICPILDKEGNKIGEEERVLPIKVIKRSLQPQGTPGIMSAGEEYFRRGEVHLTFRQEDLDPRLLALMQGMNFSSPVIPKKVLGADGNILIEDGKPVIIHDIPCTVQAARTMADLNSVTDVIISNIIMNIGGYGDASIKSEPIIAYGLYGGIDPRDQLPPVMDEIQIVGVLPDDVSNALRQTSNRKGKIGGFDTTARAGSVDALGALRDCIARKQQWPKYYDNPIKHSHKAVPQDASVATMDVAP